MGCLFVSYCCDSAEGSGRLWAGPLQAWIIASLNSHSHTSEAGGAPFYSLEMVAGGGPRAEVRWAGLRGHRGGSWAHRVEGGLASGVRGCGRQFGRALALQKPQPHGEAETGLAPISSEGGAACPPTTRTEAGAVSEGRGSAGPARAPASFPSLPHSLSVSSPDVCLGKERLGISRKRSSFPENKQTPARHQPHGRPDGGGRWPRVPACGGQAARVRGHPS